MIIPGDLFTICVSSRFEAAHSIRNYRRDALGTWGDEDIHGHSWLVEVYVSSSQVDTRTGFVVDFLTVNARLKELCAFFDHKFINEIPPFDQVNPSTENICKWFFESIETIIPPESRLAKVTVHEGPDNSAQFERSK